MARVTRPANPSYVHFFHHTPWDTGAIPPIPPRLKHRTDATHRPVYQIQTSGTKSPLTCVASFRACSRGEDRYPADASRRLTPQISHEMRRGSPLLLLGN